MLGIFNTINTIDPIDIDSTHPGNAGLHGILPVVSIYTIRKSAPDCLHPAGREGGSELVLINTHADNHAGTVLLPRIRNQLKSNEPTILDYVVLFKTFNYDCKHLEN